MRVINIIETSGTNMEPILDVKSFGVFDEKLSQDVVEKAEKHFTRLALKNGAYKDDIENHLEDGFFSQDGYTVNIVWSKI